MNTIQAKPEKELSIAEMYESTISEIKEGEIVKGTVVQIGNKDVLVDIGYKSEGVIMKSELSDPDEIKIGDKLDVIIESKENDAGMVVLSHEKARKQSGWTYIINNFKEGDSIDGKVSRKVRGGFMVDVGMEAFLPASLSAMQDVGGGDNLAGKKLNFKIVKINVQRKNIVLSRKEIVDELRKEEKQAILASLNKGDIVKGLVKNITDFGAFIDIGGGITGLLHVTDMSWGRVTKPTEIMKVGDEVEVKILDFDKDNMKVSLGYKQKTRNPWEVIEVKYPEGTVVPGKVVNIMPYGVFLELEEGIEGLIHISEFSWTKKYGHPGERFKLGDEVKAMVLKLDKDNQKLSLGLKQLESDPWQGVENRFHVGDKVQGKINTLTDYGAFMEIESGIEGLIHVSDLSWTKRVNHPKELVTKGDHTEAVILNVDEKNRRIALGVKQLIDDPWDEITDKYRTGTECAGKVANITNFGIFIELEKDLEGLLHVSEIPLGPQQRMDEIYKMGDPVKVKVIHIDGIQKKIALSVKGMAQETGTQEEKKEAPQQ
ncbi:MAG: 30S ribosomal protein S1 [Candidatus Omnitrophica bacterium]|nr:30S ribosomal protein S1 [Candidatus Omnitrophota bacterium]